MEERGRQIKQPTVGNVGLPRSVQRKWVAVRNAPVLQNPVAGSQVPPDVRIAHRRRSQPDKDRNGEGERRDKQLIEPFVARRRMRRFGDHRGSLKMWTES